MLRVTRTMTGDRRTQRLRNGLVVGQLALALGLLLSAALLLRSFTRLAAYDPGFELDGALTFWVAPPMWRYETREQRRDYYRRVARELAALPGVVAVGSASAGPLLGGGDGRTPFLVEGATQPAKQDAPTVAYFDAGPGWFPALGVSLRAGRNLSPDASVDGVVEAVVNETMARRHWPGTPVGARVRLPDWEMEAEIVGVVADMRPFGTATEPAIFVSNVQRPRGASFFVVRTGRDPERLVPSVRRVLTGIDPDAPPRQVASLRDLLHEQLVAPRFALLLIGGFAVLSLLLSTAGVYAVIAYAVSLRTREFGIRLALGARAGQVLALVLRDGGRLLAAGLLLGGLVAWFFARLLRGLIHDMAAADITALLLAGAIMTAAALVASAAPALRAARTQPASVLHAE